MNLHPIFVHFPIALLTVYALMELIRFKKVTGQPYWFYAKALFLMIGGLGALAALYTGGMAKAAVRNGAFNVAVQNFNQVLRMHENFADLTVAIFGLLAAGYLFLWMERSNFSAFAKKINILPLWNLLLVFARFFVETPFVIVMAVAGLICVTTAGGLGGVMVYGPAADPFFGFVYHILFPGQ